MRAIRRDLFILTAFVLMLAAAFVSFRAGSMRKNIWSRNALASNGKSAFLLRP